MTNINVKYSNLLARACRTVRMIERKMGNGPEVCSIYGGVNGDRSFTFYWRGVVCIDATA